MREDIKKRIEAVRQGDIPEGYLRTRAGMMPLDWQSNLSAKDIFRNHTNKKHNGEFQVLSATQDRGIIPRSEVDIDIKYAEENIGSYKKVEAGDFVISLRSFQGGIEYSEYEGLVSPAYTVLKATRPISDNYYRAYFKTPDFISRLNGAVYGIRDGKQIGFEDFGELAVHYPPLAEQQKIAEILATCDRVIELKQQLLEEKRRQRQWLMQKLLSGEIKVSQCSGEYKTMKVRDLADSLTGFPFDSDAFSEDGIRLMRCGNIGSGKTTWESKVTVFWPTTDSKLASFALQTGDVVIGMDGASVGKSCAMITDVDLPCYLVQRVTRLRSAYPVLLFQWFRSAKFIDYVKSRKTVTAIPHISEQDILEFEICVPQDDVSIRRIECILSNADKVISAMEKEIAEWQQKKKALMQLLLTGLVRVNA